MSCRHRELAAGRWNRLSFVEQMANVGSEIGRTISWRQRGNQAEGAAAFERALELLDLTINDPRNLKRLRELVRDREALADHFVFDNSYGSTDDQWQDYFLAFNYAARLGR